MKANDYQNKIDEMTEQVQGNIERTGDGEYCSIA